MDESKLKVFIDGATRYFLQVTRLAAEVGTPYLSETNETLAYDMTGIIGISGGRKGVVYFTAPTNMLRSVLINMGERDVTHDMRLDLVGEIANTIAGNARAEFGSEFMISVPVVIAGGACAAHLQAALAPRPVLHLYQVLAASLRGKAQ